MNGIRYTPLTGETVCMRCGLVLLEQAPVVPFAPPPPAAGQVRRALEMERASETHMSAGCVDCGAPESREPS